MIHIGPYTFTRISYPMRNPDSWTYTQVTDELHICHDGGEAMGCNTENERKLIEALDKFWKENF